MNKLTEFLGFRRDSKYTENVFEQALVDNLEHFIMEFRHGFL